MMAAASAPETASSSSLRVTCRSSLAAIATEVSCCACSTVCCWDKVKATRHCLTEKCSWCNKNSQISLSAAALQCIILVPLGLMTWLDSY